MIQYWKQLQTAEDLMKRSLSLVAVLFFVSAFSAHPHLCDNVFRQADSLIVKPETYTLVVKESTTFKVFLQNNMDRGIAEISLIPESSSFDFSVTPQKMSIPKGRQVYFQVTLSPRPGIRSGNYEIKFRLVGGGREFKAFTLDSLAQEAGAKKESIPDTSKLSQVRRSNGAPAIDGNLNDPVWKNAAVLSRFISSTGAEPSYPTWALMSFDRDNLYLGVFCRDEDTGKLSPRDRIDIILSSESGGMSGFLLSFPYAGAAKCQKYGRENKAAAWNLPGMKYSIMKKDKNWSLEISVPFSDLNTLAPMLKSVWNVRINRYKESGLKEKSFWAMDSSGYHNEKKLGMVVMYP
jgi:hypothetical protein